MKLILNEEQIIETTAKCIPKKKKYTRYHGIFPPTPAFQTLWNRQLIAAEPYENERANKFVNATQSSESIIICHQIICLKFASLIDSIRH